MTTIQPCVSLDSPDLPPDLRVFYQYGMVLGLDDFLQEQAHNLGLDFHHERALHGYGTVYGLAVTTSTPPDNPADVTVTVSAGMAVDQWGREATVTCAQCARLGAWLAAQGPATVEANLAPRASWWSLCRHFLRPMPPRTWSRYQANPAARARHPMSPLGSATPGISNCAGRRRSCRPGRPSTNWLVARILQVVPGLGPASSSEDDIVQAVRALAQPGLVALGSPPEPLVYQLPEATANDAFNRIFAVWATEAPSSPRPDRPGRQLGIRPSCWPAFPLSPTYP